ncbi:unnamed protein product [Brugia pahangi]|uniref:MARVEL domain-containing protein n=1 Tax=Brugia pahangi TaxID=6280 RepID=A0A0N4SX25_BRUPA|nr:unnamed protein product [Brugia pahangi]
MGDISLNTRYLSSNRGIIKIVQIVLGFVICSLLCTSWYGGRSCFGEGRIGFCSGLNFVVLIINIVLFIINFLNITAWKMVYIDSEIFHSLLFHYFIVLEERVYSAICMVLFLVAIILIIWFIVEVSNNQTYLIITTVCFIVECLLFLRDVKILQGEASN